MQDFSDLPISLFIREQLAKAGFSTPTEVQAAAIPEALAAGPGSETMVPMAIAVVGGVAFSTLLTLFVVPCAYSLFSGRQQR